MAVLVKIAQGEYSFWCPGCKTYHQYWTAESPCAKPNSTWTFNGNFECPSFDPSLLNTWGKEADPNWQEPTEPVGEGNHPWSGRCHLFVKNGQIAYCGDNWHHLKNQTVPMVQLKEEIVERYKKPINMAKVKACVDNATKQPNGNFYFICPATNQMIQLSTKVAWTPTQKVFAFNYDVERPTFSPAVKIVDGKDVSGALEPVNMMNATMVNHFTIQDGNIRYFEDSTHHLKGRTIELPEIK